MIIILYLILFVFFIITLIYPFNIYELLSYATWPDSPTYKPRISKFLIYKVNNIIEEQGVANINYNNQSISFSLKNDKLIFDLKKDFTKIIPIWLSKTNSINI